MIPGLLPIFFPGCKIKPGSGLGIRLIFPTQFVNTTWCCMSMPYESWFATVCLHHCYNMTSVLISFYLTIILQLYRKLWTTRQQWKKCYNSIPPTNRWPTDELCSGGCSGRFKAWMASKFHCEDWRYKCKQFKRYWPKWSNSCHHWQWWWVSKLT